MRGAGKGGEPGFKLGHLWPHDKAARIEHRGNPPIKLTTDQLLLGHYIE